MNLPIEIQFIDETIPYLGSELRPHFIAERFKIWGNAIVAFQGPCLVKTDTMVDLEDRFQGDRIESARMLHFLGEFFGPSLLDAVLFQRLFCATVKEVLEDMSPELSVSRSGNDLYVNNRKLSVSIVTSSVHSRLLHFGINLDPSGAPVPAIGLCELGIDPKQFIARFFEKIHHEIKSIHRACVKVKAIQ